MFGISREYLMKLAYELAEHNGIPHVFNDVNRTSGFNQHANNALFNILEELIDENQLSATRIYNVDENGQSTVQKCQKVVALKGRHQVGAITSAERGIHTTGVF